MKYKCLVFDHDDTVVNSTKSIHHPCFQEFLRLYHPDKSCTLENYFLKNFDPGFLPMCRGEYGLSEEEIDFEMKFWHEYVSTRIPPAFEGIKEIMERHKAEGGLICVISYSFDENIYRDYEANGLPKPDAVYGWNHPIEHRKPYPWPMEQVLSRFNLKREEVLMIDDLKPGFDMAQSCGVDFAAVGWANDIPQIEKFMRDNCSFYFKKVSEFAEFLEY